ncbi:hypothetical protein CDAR_607691 [Caerostris darwini]|uniref:Uncharacterized protein n=1 Tax=Caerostris darwini TaxID=1538125 RepID=A0AAV4UL68_9ARAC|nr:hypothetical protein CDAR_607691 [Caerostris darwini]
MTPSAPPTESFPPLWRNGTRLASKGQCPANVTGKRRIDRGASLCACADLSSAGETLSCRESSAEQIMGFSSLFCENHRVRIIMNDF